MRSTAATGDEQTFTAQARVGSRAGTAHGGLMRSKALDVDAKLSRRCCSARAAICAIDG